MSQQWTLSLQACSLKLSTAQCPRTWNIRSVSITNLLVFYLIQAVTYKYLRWIHQMLHEGPFHQRPPYQAETKFYKQENTEWRNIIFSRQTRLLCTAATREKRWRQRRTQRTQEGKRTRDVDDTGQCHQITWTERYDAAPQDDCVQGHPKIQRMWNSKDSSSSADWCGS
jgi:hypothetical protein